MSEADKTPIFDTTKIASQEAMAAFEQQDIPIKSFDELSTKFVPEQDRILAQDTQALMDALSEVEIPKEQTGPIKEIGEAAKAIQEKARARAREELSGQPIKSAKKSESAKTPEDREIIGIKFEQTRENQEPEKIAREFSEAAQNLLDRQLAWLKQQIENAENPERKQFLIEWTKRLNQRKEIIAELENGARKPEKDKAIKEGTINEVMRLGVGEETGAFKPSAGENINMADNYGFERFQAYRREWLASQINDALGLNVVPPTVVRNTEKGIGSLQQWQNTEPDASLLWENSKSETRKQDLEEISVLHYITDQADGHYGNVMLDENGRIKAFDNGISFGCFDSIAHAEILMRNGLNLEQARKGITHIYKKGDARPELKSAPMIELLEGRAEPYPLSENISENIRAFLAEPALQRGISDCFDAVFEDDSGKKFGEFFKKLSELSDKGLPPYKYPSRRRK